MTEHDIEMTALRLLADHGVRAIDLIILRCSQAAELGAADILSFWNDVLGLICRWSSKDRVKYIDLKGYSLTASRAA